MILPEQMPARPADQHRLLERLANQQISDEQARLFIRSPEAHRAFIAALCDGMKYAAGKPRA